MADLASLIAEVLDATADKNAAIARLDRVRPLLEAELRNNHIKSMDPPGAEIVITQPKDVATVVDMPALVAYVAKNAPSEIVDIPATKAVRERFLTAILDQAAKKGVALDPDDGNTIIPGVEVNPGKSVMQVRLKGADE